MALDMIEITNSNSKQTKLVPFCGWLYRGGWFQIRYPGGAGLWAFSLRHGRMEHKRGEHPSWFIAAAELDRVRAVAREEKVEFSVETPRAKKKGKPGQPKLSPSERQMEFGK